jgi:hypothetical protein
MTAERNTTGAFVVLVSVDVKFVNTFQKINIWVCEQHTRWNSGCGVDHPLPSSAEVKERAELQFCCPSGPLWSAIGGPLPFIRWDSSYLSSRFTINNHRNIVWGDICYWYLLNVDTRSLQTIMLRAKAFSGISAYVTGDTVRLLKNHAPRFSPYVGVRVQCVLFLCNSIQSQHVCCTVPQLLSGTGLYNIRCRGLVDRRPSRL